MTKFNSEYNMIKVRCGVVRRPGEEDKVPELVLGAMKDAGSRGWDVVAVLPTDFGAAVYIKRVTEV